MPNGQSLTEAGRPAPNVQRVIPPAPTHANPLSVRNAHRWKHSNECHFCAKPKKQGGTLFRCAGCQDGFYCSKECQRKAWPDHKLRCQIHQRARDANPTILDQYKLLSSFMNKHRYTLTQAGFCALDLRNHPENAQDRALVVLVRQRPAKRAEFTYFVVGAEVIPLNEGGFGEDLDEIKMHLTIHKMPPGCLVFVIVMRSLDSNHSNVVPVGFYPNPVYYEHKDWKEWMMKHLNEGIVLL
ncbi:hypothetical protein BDN72DRAFT_902446 [Pluteus cervinus]|uniref:Uncharacterized protein n=1 Tax=Pluteus cervinus TaxID=181527 RepID=A0ACD3ACN7_9AGAR|nr:hypothetical protein BDN72DRAFT_902446 [Pluteus cervinus]